MKVSLLYLAAADSSADCDDWLTFITDPSRACSYPVTPALVFLTLLHEQACCLVAVVASQRRADRSFEAMAKLRSFVARGEQSQWPVVRSVLTEILNFKKLQKLTD
jgi:hypothetical protein